MPGRARHDRHGHLSPSRHSPLHRNIILLQSKTNDRSFIFSKDNSMTAEYKVHGDVAVITMNNPPVNGLGYSTRVGLTDGLAKANDDASVKSIVITGAGKAFSGGADINEF